MDKSLKFFADLVDMICEKQGVIPNKFIKGAEKCPELFSQYYADITPWVVGKTHYPPGWEHKLKKKAKKNPDWYSTMQMQLFEDYNEQPKPVTARIPNGKDFSPYQAISRIPLTKEEKHAWFVRNPDKDKSRCPNEKIIVDENLLAENLDWKPNVTINPDLCKERQIADFKSVKKMNLDIETLGLLNDKGEATEPIVAIGFNLSGDFSPHCVELIKEFGDVTFIENEGTNEAYWIATNTNEKELLQALIECLNITQPSAICTHNGFSFDIPYIQQRCQVNGLRSPFMIPSDAKERILTSGEFNGMAPTYKEPQINQFCIKGQIDFIDTFLIATRHDKMFRNLKSLSLKNLAINPCKKRTNHRLEIGGEINTYWEQYLDGDNTALESIKTYLLEDLKDQVYVTNYFCPSYYFIGLFCPLPFQTLCLASPPLILNAMAKAYYRNKKGRHYPHADKSAQYEGALVDAFPGVYPNTFVADVASLYPSIMLRYALPSNSKDPDNYILAALDKLKAMRMHYKAQKKTGATEEDRIKAAGIEKSLKICINGFYGALGVGGYAYNDVEGAALVTAYGRVILTQMINKLNDLGITIPMWDTDGVAFSLDELNLEGTDPKAKNWDEMPSYIKILHHLQNNIPEGIILELDDAGNNTPGNEPSYILGNMAVLAKKNYIGFRKNTLDPNIIHETKKKGDTNKRANAVVKTEFLINYLKHLTIYGIDSANKFYLDLLEQLKDGSYPLEKLLITKKIPKSDQLLSLAGIGDKGEKVTFFWSSIRMFGKNKEKKTCRFPIKVIFAEDDFDKKYPIPQDISSDAKVRDGKNIIDVDPQLVSGDYATLVSDTYSPRVNSLSARFVNDGYLDSLHSKYLEICHRLNLQPVEV